MKKWTGCDEAIVGLGHRCGCDTVVVYDYDKLVDVFIQQGMEEEESIEWIKISNSYIQTAYNNCQDKQFKVSLAEIKQVIELLYNDVK